MIALNKDPKTTPAYQNSCRWLSGLSIEHRTDYAVVLEHAIRNNAALLKLAERLDDKADGLLKFSTALIVALIALLKSSPNWQSISLQLIPAATLLIVGAVLSLVARRRASWPIGVGVDELFNTIHNTPDGYAPPHMDGYLRATLAATYQVTNTELRVVIKQRADLAAWSGRLIVLGVASLMLLFF